MLTNRHGTVLHDNKEKPCQLIDIALPDDSNVNTTETERIRELEALQFAVSRLC